MEILVNGDSKQLPEGASAAVLIEQLELGGQRVAMEVNGEILPRSQYQSHQLEARDRVEIIRAVGGG